MQTLRTLSNASKRPANLRSVAPAACAALFLCVCTACAQPQPGDYKQAREDLARELTRSVFGRTPVESAAVLGAIRAVPRHEFVPESLRRRAYDDRPLPIGHDQTISQPYVVAIMTEAIDPDPADRVLEVGTGSGYQAAVLAEIVDHVYTIEIVPELGRGAAATLDRLGYDNVDVKIGDGYQGWPEHAPFDAVIVTAAPDHIPEPLIEQLKPGGKMIIPVGPEHSTQELVLLTKDEAGELSRETIELVRFVPMTGEAQDR